jgi:DNA-binding cell septation regulator SpoVG
MAPRAKQTGEKDMEIKVVQIRSLSEGRALRAYADVQVGDWIIYEWRIIKKDGQRAWVSVPMASWKNFDHKVRYRALLSIPDELKQRIEVAILSAWEKEERSGKTDQ